MASPSYRLNYTPSFDNMFENLFSDMERERKNRIKKLERIRERRYLDCKSFRKIGQKGDFSYLDEYGKRLEEDMAILKEVTKQREEQESNWVPRPLSPLPPLFDISPVQSPREQTYRLIGNEDYQASRMAAMSEMGLTGVMQEFYGGESNPYSVSGPEGAAIAAERLQRINERIDKLKVRAVELQDGIQGHMGGSSEEEREDEGDNNTSFSGSPYQEEEEEEEQQQQQEQQCDTPEIKITQEED